MARRAQSTIYQLLCMILSVCRDDFSPIVNTTPRQNVPDLAFLVTATY